MEAPLLVARVPASPFQRHVTDGCAIVSMPLHEFGILNEPDACNHWLRIARLPLRAELLLDVGELCRVHLCALQSLHYWGRRSPARHAAVGEGQAVPSWFAAAFAQAGWRTTRGSGSIWVACALWNRWSIAGVHGCTCACSTASPAAELSRLAIPCCFPATGPNAERPTRCRCRFCPACSAAEFTWVTVPCWLPTTSSAADRCKSRVSIRSNRWHSLRNACRCVRIGLGTGPDLAVTPHQELAITLKANLE